MACAPNQAATGAPVSAVRPAEQTRAGLSDDGGLAGDGGLWIPCAQLIATAAPRLQPQVRQLCAADALGGHDAGLRGEATPGSLALACLQEKTMAPDVYRTLARADHPPARAYARLALDAVGWTLGDIELALHDGYVGTWHAGCSHEAVALAQAGVVQARDWPDRPAINRLLSRWAADDPDPAVMDAALRAMPDEPWVTEGLLRSLAADPGQPALRAEARRRLAVRHASPRPARAEGRPPVAALAPAYPSVPAVLARWAEISCPACECDVYRAEHRRARQAREHALELERKAKAAIEP